MPGEKQEFSQLTEAFIYGSLALSPVSATAAGYHRHREVALDEKLDDFSHNGIQEQRLFYAVQRGKLDNFQLDALSPEDRADAALIKDQIELALLDINRIQSFRHNPTIYVELIGNALFNPYVLEYAPKDARYRHIIKRLAAIPILLEQARANLVDSPEVWNRVAREENDGNIALVDQTLRAAAPPNLKSDYDRAAKRALAALRDFNNYLKTDLAKQTVTWRLGKEKYDPKFKLTLDTGKTPSEVLSDAEAALKDTRAEMVKLAAPQSVPDALKRIADKHATPETYFEEARRDLESATAFVKARHLLALPSGDNLKVVPTPEFMRGGYGVGGFAPAPVLEPQLGAFYWITPIPQSWPKDRTESKLREYNTYGLQELTIHEAMPGHYVQFQYANQVQPQARRMLRGLYGSVPYVEGWGVYAQQVMSDEGYLASSADLRLTFLKQMLRVIGNAILDIRLQTMDMSEEQAMDLMLNQTYQEKEEAVAKLQRAQLASCQLPTYFVGWRGWLRAREEYKKAKGSGFQLSDFHERALKEGAVTLPSLQQLLSGR